MLCFLEIMDNASPACSGPTIGGMEICRMLVRVLILLSDLFPFIYREIYLGS
jgi:hypothetical protein